MSSPSVSPGPVAKAPPSFVRPGDIAALLIAAVLFAAVTGYGTLHAGYNPDDWRHIHGDPSWAEMQGRWGQDLIFHYVLGGSFHLPFQLLLAFVCFVAITRILTGLAAPLKGASWIGLAMFVTGVNHVYMGDALNFDAHTLAFPFALLMSLLAFLLLFTVVRPGGKLVRNALVFLAASQLLAVSYATYQPYAMFGVVLPVLALILWDRFPLRTVIVLAVLSVAMIGLALWLQRVEGDIIMSAQGRTTGSNRFVTPGLGNLRAKLAMLPGSIRMVLTGRLLAPPVWVKLGVAVFTLAAAAAPLAATLVRLWGGSESLAERTLAILRAAFGSLLIVVVLPVTFWFATIENGLPPRAVAYYGFWLAALLCSALALLAGARGDRWQTRALARLTFAALAGFAVVNAAASVALWRDQARLRNAELALAADVVAAVRQVPGHEGKTVRLIGSGSFPVRDWGAMLGAGVFQKNNPTHEIFSLGLGVPWQIVTAPLSAIACPAFPRAGSVFVRDGDVNVCLAAQQPAVPIDRCVNTGDTRFGAICRVGDVLLRRLPSCIAADDSSHRFETTIRDRGGSRVWKGKVLSTKAFRIDDHCYMELPLAPVGNGTFLVVDKGPDGEVIQETPVTLP